MQNLNFHNLKKFRERPKAKSLFFNFHKVKGKKLSFKARLRGYMES